MIKNKKRNIPIMNLQGQLSKIDKVDETVAMPTVRNYSPGAEDEQNNESILNQ